MTKDRLQSLSVNALKDFASKKSLSFQQDATAEQLIDLIVDALEEEQTERESSNNSAMRIKEKKYDATRQDGPESEAGAENYPIPDSYNETRIMVMLRDPEWAFTYWDIKDTDLAPLTDESSKAKLYLRVQRLSDSVYEKDSIVDSHDIPVKLSDKSWYIHLPHVHTHYCLELRCRNGEGSKVLCRSNILSNPGGVVAGGFFEDLAESADEILMLSGLQDADPADSSQGIPQRIISILDTQYLHLTG